jgi:hypothetical protein
MQRQTRPFLLLGLEVVEKDGPLGRLLTPVLDDDTRAVDDLARVAFPVQDTETSPLSQLLAIRDLDQRDLVLGAQSNDELLVGLLLASLVQDAHVSLASVEGLGGFTETAGKTVVHQGELEDALESIKNGHLALGGLGRDLDLLGGIGSVVLFYVRHLGLCDTGAILEELSGVAGVRRGGRRWLGLWW